MPFKCRTTGLLTIFVSIFCVFVATAVFLLAYSEGPPAGANGGLAINTCNQSGCHESFPVNDPGSGSAITLSGFPTTYTPGRQYNLSITVGAVTGNPAGRRRFGFQLSARSTASPFGALGTFTLTDPGTGFDFDLGQGTSPTPVTAAGAVFVSHNVNKTCLNNTSCTWNVTWTAPSVASGVVEFDVAGNAADGDFTNSGDYILTTKVMASPAAPAPSPEFSPKNPSFPHIGGITGGTRITVNGANFVSGAKVFFGTTQAPSTTLVSSSQLTAIAPAVAAAGQVDLKVVNPDNQSATLPGAFNYYDNTVLTIADAVASGGSGKRAAIMDQWSFGKSSSPAALGVAPAGSGVFSFTQNNILVTTVGTPSAVPTTSFMMFADSKPFACATAGCALQNNTGLAIMNRSGGVAHLTYTLRSPDGTVAAGVAPVTKTLANGAHDQGFITDIFGAAGNNFTGSLQVDSDVPVSALTLQLNSNQAPRNETLFTSLPVADLTQPSPNGNLIFSQLLDGGGYQTRVILLNTTTNPISGKVFFFKDDGTAASFDFGSGPVQQLSYTIPSRGEFSALSKGAGALNVGFGLVAPDAGKATPVGTGVFVLTQNGFTVTTVGIPSSPTTTSGLILADSNATATGLAQDTGLALANPSATGTADVMFTLQDLATGNVVASKMLSQIPGHSPLPPHGHAALFVDQIFAGGQATGFTGTLSISTTSPEGISALTLLLTTNQRGDALFTTLPVATAVSSTGPVFWPQLVSGSGFSTQLILLNPSTTTASGVLNFFDSAGSAAALPLNDQITSSFNYSIPPNGGATFR